MKKIILFIYGAVLFIINIIALVFIWDTKGRYELSKEIEQKAKEAKEKKENEIKNKKPADVRNDYLSDDSKSGVAGVKKDSDKRIDNILG